jgi:hypothetical protein
LDLAKDFDKNLDDEISSGIKPTIKMSKNLAGCNL